MQGAYDTEVRVVAKYGPFKISLTTTSCIPAIYFTNNRASCPFVVPFDVDHHVQV